MLGTLAWSSVSAAVRRTLLKGVCRMCTGHWLIGYFPSYALGIVIAAQFWESLRSQVPELEAQISVGIFPASPAGCAKTCMGLGAKVPVRN